MDSIDILFEKGCSLESDVVFFPVRHHSPACAMHLTRIIESYAPDTILVEGPADTNHLIEYIADGETCAPVCIYYAFTEKVEETTHRHSSYFPLLDYSPELVAIRQGAARGIPVKFIDLPYSELFRIERDAAQEQSEEKHTYYNDYLMWHNTFIDQLCEKENCRNYAELWEKWFEIGGLSCNCATFMKNMLAICWYSREACPESVMQQDGTLARETFMAAEIASARTTYKKILVVTGGFHTPALIAALDQKHQSSNLRSKSDSYLIPFSMEESDQLSGYASGMPYPAFYQKVSENLLKNGPEHCYDDAVMDSLVRLGGTLRKYRESTSIADEIAAANQAKGLSLLRGKPQQGVYEFWDAVKSTYVKHALESGVSTVLTHASKMLRGDSMGKVSACAEQVPLLLDFQETARRLRLKLDTTIRQEVILDLLSKPSHREASTFFHRMDYLDTQFGQKVFGPNYRTRDTSRVREKWTYASSSKVQSRIIDVSFLGGTIREAAAAKLSRAQEDGKGSGAYSAMLIDASIMDLLEFIPPLCEKISSSVAEDGSFFSLCEAIDNLLFLQNAKWLLNLPDMSFSDAILHAIYNKACAMIPTLATTQEEEDVALAKSIKTLFSLTDRMENDPAVFWEALEELTGRQDSTAPCLQGAAAGLLYSADRIDADGALAYAQSYLFGSGEKVKQSGIFLRGLFLSAWDLVFADSRFLDGLSNVLLSIEWEDFLNLLPDLRLAFSTFTPLQIDRISGIVSELLGLTGKLSDISGYSEPLLNLGQTLDTFAAPKLAQIEVMINANG